MISRGSVPIAVLAVAVAAALQSAPSAQATPWWAQDRRPIAAISLFNGTWDPPSGVPPNPYGLLDCWRRGSQSLDPKCAGQGGVPWLMGEIRRRYKIGYRRFLLHLPAGKEQSQAGIPLPSSQWHVIDSSEIDTTSGSVQQDFQEQLTPWLAARPDVQVVIYQGLRFDSDNLPEPWLTRGDMDPDHATVPDPTDPEHRNIIRQNTLGWLGLTPRSPLFLWQPPQIGFAFDNSGVPNTRDALLAILQDPTLLGHGGRVFVSGEAIPHEVPSPPCQSVQLLPEYLTQAPWFGLLPFHREHDPDEQWIAPPGTHLGFAVRNKEKDTCAGGNPLRNGAIERSICSAYHRGFVIIHYGGDFDRFIRDVYNKPDTCGRWIPAGGGQ